MNLKSANSCNGKITCSEIMAVCSGSAPSSVMQKELDKIEKNASRVSEQKNMAKSAADVLMKDVKVQATSNRLWYA